jgi:hypothetical protein
MSNPNVIAIPTTSVNVYDDMLQRLSEKLTEDLVKAQAQQTITEIAAAKSIQILVMQSLAEARASATMLATPNPPPPAPPPPAPSNPIVAP